MAGVNYDSWEGTKRLAEAAEQIDKRAPEIFAYHVALELELDVVLAALLPRADKLSRLGFQHKVSVLNAAWIGDGDSGDKLSAALVRFNDLRNAIAHFDRGQIDGAFRKLRQAYAEIAPRRAEEADVAEIATGICVFMGDDPTAVDEKVVAVALNEFVERWKGIISKVPPAPSSVPSDAIRKIARDLTAGP